MDISPQDFKNIQGFMKHADENLHYECEARVDTRVITKEGFSRVFSYIRSNPEFGQVEESQVLTISIEHDSDWSGYRLHIGGGVQAVMDYCRTNRIPDMSSGNKYVDYKTRVEDMPPVKLTEYPLKFDIKHEEPVSDPDKIERFIKQIENPNTLKHFRFKKRYSYHRGVFRLDLTTIKSPSIAARTLVQSGLFKVADTYEIELEYTGSKEVSSDENDSKPKVNVKSKVKKEKTKGGAGSETDTPKKKQRHASFYDESVHEAFSILGNVLRSVTNTHLLMKHSEVEDIRIGYAKLVSGEKNIDLTKIFRYTRIAPQPITLEKVNALPPGSTNHTICEGYSVTEKADGLRYLLYIDESRRGYLMSSLKLKPIYTGMQFNTPNCVLDGELITEGRKGVQLFEYLVFDAYIHNGKSIKSLPHLGDESSRMAIAKQILANHTKLQDIGLTMRTKDFLLEPIFKSTKSILDKDARNQFMYHIDGVIFTPTGPIDTLSQFKWKPPSESTMDLRVKFQNISTTLSIEGRSEDFKLVSLLVIATQEDIHPIDILENRINKNKMVSEDVFATAYLPVDPDTRKVITTKTRETIDENSIVEFRYDTTIANEKLRWIPKIIRSEKLTPNSSKNVSAVLNSILNPITQDMISGLEKIESGTIDDLYYQNVAERRSESKLKAMLEFHNNVIKRKHLLERFRGKATKLFDIGVGQAGDMDKWVKAGFKMIIGVDVSSDNLLINTKDNKGAYARYQEALRRGMFQKDMHRMLFCVMDAGELWTPDYISSLKGQNEYLAQVIFGSRLSEKSIKEASIRPFYKAARQAVDVVSCQFAIHYFFKDARTLQNLCENIKSILRPGGYFIGTCFDGFMVNQKLSQVSKGEYVEGVDDGKIQWRITKKYDEYDTTNPAATVGKRIGNFISRIGQEYDEYLVDYTYLVDMLRDHADMHPLTHDECLDLGLTGDSSTGLFSELYDESIQMSSIAKEYSFLNRWFIFRMKT